MIKKGDIVQVQSREVIRYDAKHEEYTVTEPAFEGRVISVYDNGDDLPDDIRYSYIVAPLGISEDFGDDSDGFEVAQRHIELNAVMTAAEAAEEFSLSESAVRKAIERGQIPARKAGKGTWLVLRADAESKWGKK